MITLVSNADTSTRYLEEIVSHAGLAWRWKDIAGLDASDGIIVLTGHASLDTPGRERIADRVRSGTALIVTGGTAGLDEIVGASQAGPAVEGYLTGLDARHAVSAGIHAALHGFEATPLWATNGTTLARLVDAGMGTVLGDGIVVSRHGAGTTLAIAVNIPASVLHIQNGTPVHADGEPAPDGTAPLDDGILKAEDGLVLSWEHDRVQTAQGRVPECTGIDPAYPAGDTPWFAVPIADELRLLLLQGIAWAARQTGRSLVMLQEWPNGHDAVTMMSHDSDLNLDASAHTTLRLLDEAGISSTWCHMWGPRYADTYEPGTFPMIRDAGHELALHYNAFETDGGTWGREHLAAQAAFVRNEAGVDGFVSNKNHYTRWEGHLGFYHWLVDEGIEIDQSRGPSKKGTVGYPFGSSLPTMPLHPETGHFIDVLELPMQFQDLSLTTPPYMAATTREQARRHHGVAHYLFHQIHLHTKGDVVDAFRHLVSDVHNAGMEWWTSSQINDWKRTRRLVTTTMDGDTISISAPLAIPGATIAILPPTGTPAESIRVTNGSASCRVSVGERWNQPVAIVQLDLTAGETVLRIV